MTFRRSTSLLTAVVLLAGTLAAQDAAPAATPAPAPAAPAPAAPDLTLEQCIARALQHNFDLEAFRYDPEIAKAAIDIARDPFQPVLSVNASRSHSRTVYPDSAVIADPLLSPRTLSDTTLANASVTEQFYSGTTVTVSSQLERSHLDPTIAAYNPAYDADLTLSIRQQLLRGFGTAVNKAQVNRARIGFDKANLDFKAHVLDVIQNTENAYFNVVFARDQLDVRKFSLNLADRLLSESRTRRETGVATDLDVSSAEVGVANARRGVLLAEQSVGDTQEALLALIGQFELSAPLGAMHFDEVGYTLPVVASSLEMAKSTQPDYLSAQAALEQARLDLQVAKDNTKPSLSVGGAVGLNGTRDNAGSAFDDAANSRSNNWQLDVALTYPWGQVGDRARYRQANATLNQIQTRLRQLEQTIEVQVRSAVRAVETNAESVKISGQARELSEKQYELEKAKFDAGLSTSYLVLQAQNDLENAKVAEIQSRVSLRSAIVALHRIEGSSLQRYKISLP
ncbi:MAG TPA: TolC family protein [Candidatus Didemnitutus sp.]|nr:TolC family protein [Candidatus Didemnitutus sp.]